MSRVVRWVIATAILFAVIVWVELQLGWTEVLKGWTNIPISNLVILTLLTFLSYGIRAYRVYWYFGRDDGHGFLPYLRINLIHNAWNNFLPMRLGEASFPLMMKRAFGVSLISSAAGLLWIRLMDLHWLLVLMAGIATWNWSGWYSLVLVGLIVGPVVAVIFVEKMGVRRIKLIDRIWLKLVENSPRSWLDGLLVYGFTAMTWMVKLGALTLIMLSFIALPWAQGALAVVTADLSSVLPIHGLAGSGTYEAAMLTALVPMGQEADAVLGAAVNVHIYILLTTLLALPIAFVIPARIEITNN